MIAVFQYMCKNIPPVKVLTVYSTTAKTRGCAFISETFRSFSCSNNLAFSAQKKYLHKTLFLQSSIATRTQYYISLVCAAAYVRTIINRVCDHERMTKDQVMKRGRSPGPQKDVALVPDA
jgi:hypothetical protein